MLFTRALVIVFTVANLHAYAQEGAGETVQKEKPVIDKRYQGELKALSDQAAIKAAFKSIMDLEPETYKDLITLTEIPAPPYKEQKRAAKVRDMMQAIGVDSLWMDKAGNVIALKKGKNGSKTVVLEAHLDTVFPEVPM